MASTPSRLIGAAKAGDADEVRRLLAAISADELKYVRDDENGQTPLLLAAEAGHLAVVNVFLADARVDVMAKCKDWKKSAMHYACEKGKLEVVKRLVQCAESENSKLDVNSLDEELRTPLHTACEEGQTPVVEHLLTVPGIKVDGKDDSKKYLIHHAAESGKLDIVKMVLEYPAVRAHIGDIDDSDYTPLMHACYGGHFAVVDYLLQQEGVKVNGPVAKETPLHVACFSGSLESVKRLLEEDDIVVDVYDDYHESPLHSSCHKGNIEILECLLATESINVNSVDNAKSTALHSAVENRKTNEKFVLRMLEVPGINLTVKNDEGKSAMFLALQEGYKEAFAKMWSFDWLKIEKSVFDLALSKPDIFPDDAAREDFQTKYLSQNVNFLPRRHLSDIKELSSGNFGMAYRAELFVGTNGTDDVRFAVVLKVAKGETGSDECTG